MNPNNVLLNDDALKIAKPDDFRRVGEGIWENPNIEEIGTFRIGKSIFENAIFDMTLLLKLRSL